MLLVFFLFFKLTTLWFKLLLYSKCEEILKMEKNQLKSNKSGLNQNKAD